MIEWVAWFAWLGGFLLMVRLRPRLKRLIDALTGDEGFIEVP